MGANTDQAVTLVVQVNPEATGSILNTDYGIESDQVTRMEGETIETEVFPHSLLVSGSTSSDTIAPGRLLTYTLTVSNPHQFATTHHTLLVGTLPEGTEFITATTPHTLTGDTITWLLGDLTPQATRDAELVVQVPLTATVGTIIINNYHARSDEVAPVPGEAIQTLIHNLQVNKEASGAVGVQGGVLTYTLTVTNMQPVSATHGLLLTDTLPTGTTFLTATLPHTNNGGVVTWTHPSLEPNTSWQVELVVQISPTAQGTLFNGIYGVISEEATTPARGGPVLTPIHAPGIQLTPDSSRLVHPGTVISYTHLLINTGNLSDTFELALSSTQGWGTSSNTSVILEPGESQVLIVRVVVPPHAQAGTIDKTRLVATSLAKPSLVAVVTDTTRVAFRAFFPRIFYQFSGSVHGD
jgi:uncharacterized repeat protein (TIGR01451 family)